MEPPPPKDLSHHYSRVIQRTERSAIKKFYKYFSIPNVGNLAGGLPDPAYFPYDTLEAHVALPTRFKPTPSTPVKPSPPLPRIEKQSGHAASPRIVVPHDSQEVDRNKRIDLATSLQYGRAQGLPPLSLWLRDFTRTKMHPNVPYQGGPEIVLTNGSTDGFSKALQTFSNVWDDRKDWIRERQGVLCEEFAYMNAIQAIRPRGLNVVPVAMDDEGMMAEGPGGLRDVLENWDRSKGRIPHLMYTVTMGQNPTSGVLSIPRRKEIYSLCQKYDILIIEDDPYWFLQYPSANQLSLKHRGKPLSTSSADPSMEANWKSSGSAFLDSLVPSYLSVDTEGRVIRLDTFSKTIAPGCRLGWVTAQPDVIERMLSLTDCVTQQPSGFVQSLVAELVLGQHSYAQQYGQDGCRAGGKPDNSWQTDGWIRWLEGLRGNYERRMQVVSQIIEHGKYKIDAQTETSTRRSAGTASDDFEVVSRTQMLDFTFPMGGMFLWLRMHFENHPLFGHPKVPNDKLSLALFIFLTTPDYLVLVAPGFIFCPTDKIRDEKGWMYFRLCFAAVHEEVLEKTSQSFIRACNDFFDIDDPQKIDDITKDAESAVHTSFAQLEMEMDGISNASHFAC